MYLGALFGAFSSSKVLIGVRFESIVVEDLHLAPVIVRSTLRFFMALRVKICRLSCNLVLERLVFSICAQHRGLNSRHYLNLGRRRFQWYKLTADEISLRSHSDHLVVAQHVLRTLYYKFLVITLRTWQALFSHLLILSQTNLFEFAWSGHRRLAHRFQLFF